jgi:serine/threonine-protein kinase
MAYVNPPDPGPTTLAWVDREGREEPIVAPPHRYEWVRAAPDGTRLAVGYRDSDLDVAIWDIRRATLMPLRFASTERANGPVWTPDSSRIIVQVALPNGPSNLWWAAADGSDTAERLTTSSNTQRPTGVSPDGKHIVLMEARGSLDVMQLALDRTRRVTPLIDEAASFDAGAVVSPDGRWLAYESDVSGQMEIYVCPYPAVRTSSVRVSQMGGMAPRWLPKTGGELFFVSPDGAFMRVSVETTSRTWQAGPPTKVRQLEGYGTGSSYGPYDIAPDGRIVVIKGSVPPPEVVLVLNWNRELARLAPAR